MEEPIDVGNNWEDEEDEEDEVKSVELFKKLTQVPLGKGLAENIQDLKERPSGREAYAKAMSYPQKIVEQIFSRLELEGRRVEVMEYATKENFHIFLDIQKTEITS